MKNGDNEIAILHRRIEDFIDVFGESAENIYEWEGNVLVIKADDLRELGKDFVLVPREPTEAMIMAGLRALLGKVHFSKQGYEKDRMKLVYKAMIASAEEIK